MEIRSSLLATGLPDPRQKTREDLMRLYSDYVLSGPKPAARKAAPAAPASDLPGWGEITEAEEEEVSEDKGQVIEPMEEEEDRALVSGQPLDEVEVEEEIPTPEDIEEEIAAPVSKKNVYEEELLEALKEAQAKLLVPKKLGIADILGAGTMRRSAELIRSTEKENEARQQTAQQLALDILMRKSGSEEKRMAAEETARYRQSVIDAQLERARIAAGRKTEDPSQVRADRIEAQAMFPNLKPDEAYAKYIRDVKRRERPPAAPRPALITRMAQIAIKRDKGTATPEELQELKMYEEQQKRSTNILDLLLQRQGGI